MPVLLRKQTALCLPVLSVSRGPDRAPPPPGAHKERMNPLRRSSCQRKSRRDFGVQHDGVANASSCHAQVTMEGRVFPKKNAWRFLGRFFCVVWVGAQSLSMDLYRMRCAALVFGLPKNRVARLDVSSRGVGACLYTKTRGRGRMPTTHGKPGP